MLEQEQNTGPKSVEKLAADLRKEKMRILTAVRAEIESVLARNGCIQVVRLGITPDGRIGGKIIITFMEVEDER